MKRRVKTTIAFSLLDDSGRERSPFLRTGIILMEGPLYVTCSRVESYAGSRFMLLYFAKGGDPAKLATATEIGAIDVILGRGIAQRLWVPSWPHPDQLRINIALIGGVDFCEAALENVFHVLTSFGVSYSEALEYVQGFEVTQKEEIKWRKEWMSYAQYLRLTLPILQG